MSKEPFLPDNASSTKIKFRSAGKKQLTPVAFFIFNRPETTARVFEMIRLARPSRLLVVADGPRAGYPEDESQCQAARRFISEVNWDCEVQSQFSELNLGLKKRMESGLDWVFEQVEEAIILEDDCVPHLRFFRFCEELLERYRDENQIMTIGGSSFDVDVEIKQSYYFSRYPLIWGWATWRRAWRRNDPTMQDWPAALRSNWLNEFLQDERAAQFWSYQFQDAFEKGHTWDYAWTFSCWRNQGLSIIPARNLVSNIGFGPKASHTRDVRSFMANRPVETMEFPLLHPKEILRDAARDQRLEEMLFGGSVERIFSKIRSRREEREHS